MKKRVKTYKKQALTPRQERFVRLYWKSSNGVQSYMTAFQTKNYYMASTEASRLLKNHLVKKRLEELMRAESLSDEITHENWLNWTINQRNTLISKRGYHNTAVRLHDMLGKAINIYGEKKENANVKVNQLVMNTTQNIVQMKEEKKDEGEGVKDEKKGKFIDL